MRTQEPGYCCYVLRITRLAGYGAPELESLVRIAKKYGLVIFSDEIHADLVYSGNRHQMVSVLAQRGGDDVSIITAVAPSKTFNIPGLNLSAMIVPDPESRKKLFPDI